jgi:hypothetical protein
VPETSAASVTWFGESLFFETEHQTVAGFWVADLAFTECPDSSENEAIGLSLVNALLVSQHGVATPDWSHRPVRPLLKRCGFRYESELVKRSKLVHVRQSAELMTLVPTPSEGKCGYRHLPDRAVTCPLTPGVAGLALKTALDASDAYHALALGVFRRLVRQE